MSKFSRKKVFVLITFLCLIVVAVWYVSRPYDYTVSFKSKALIGTINQTLKLWNTNLEESQPIDQIDINHLLQRLKLNDTDYTLNWELSQKDDSTTQVNVGIKKSQNGLMSKINIIYNKDNFKGKVKDLMTDFVLVLDTHLEKFKVRIEGKTTFPATYCAYIPVKTKQFLKAKGMMENYGILDNFLVENNVTPNGRPVVEITSWDRKTDSISFNFCYPIIKKENLPNHPSIRYKDISERQSLMAVYNGNYITSDRAWYALLDYAEKNNINLNPKPIEVFITNPNMGGDELNWQAEIYMPLKNKQ